MAASRLSISTTSSMDEDLPLPFPTALPRESFLTPDFHAPTYLSTLAGRHQTLEDLRSDLRERSGLISAEMHALVNTNWAEFLSLGVGLRGGEERIEGVRVAVLGFKRALEEIQGSVKSRKEETRELCQELDQVAKAKEAARSMLDLHEGVLHLEATLGVTGTQAPAYYPDTDSEDEDGDGEGGKGRDHNHGHVDEPCWIGVCPTRLKAMALDLTRLQELAERVGKDVPFTSAIEERISKCRKSLLLDLWTGLKEGRQAKERGTARVMDYLSIYTILGAEAEAVDKLKG
ncbi:hypothetical protein MKZ38_009608 [Zalerion maritima]|uniref:Conserved oligomeric Golgi complex subunit 2 n=1 Tax=Zalerion maritima TaxID=339359 RepID=A0AAD5WN27_9PEZI|nr:hypothetical protein MKZ38_009608 [Zalerion maritima]